jgi:hypothetical protein
MYFCFFLFEKIKNFFIYFNRYYIFNIKAILLLLKIIFNSNIKWVSYFDILRG